MIISWNVTKACNINCIHCYRDAGAKQPNELTTEEGKKAGNVRETDFDIIWRESALFQGFCHEPLKGGCGSCGFESICGGCLARAYYYSGGDYLAEEPWCAYGR
jgi:radical SAM protein with 4Fe4S-binding SPASM domain